MGRKKDTQLYTYFKGFRINNATKKIVSMVYHDTKSGKTVKLSHVEKPQIKNTATKTYYLPTFQLSTINKDELLKDPVFISALEFKRKFNRENHAIYSRAKANVDWQNQWGANVVELEKFEKWRKQIAPINYSNEISFLRRVVFRFFLNEKVCSNPLNWYRYHFEFKEWLKSIEKQNGRGKTDGYSYNSMNNIIKALNAYYKYLQVVENQVVPQKCTTFDRRYSKEKGVESVIPMEEQEALYTALGNLKIMRDGEEIPHPKAQLYKIMFKTLLNTGMRKNEVLGLSLQDVAIGKLREDFGYVSETLKLSGADLFGHIYLQSQPKNKPFRSEDGTVERKPLKLKRKISGNNSRYIPLLNKDNTKELGQLILEQKRLFKERRYGDNKSNYLLFDGISYDELNMALKKLYATKEFEKFHNYTVHDTRHTFSTYLCKFVRGQVSVVSRILGHSREQITLNYLHLGDMIDNKKEIDDSVKEIEEIDLENLKAL